MYVLGRFVKYVGNAPGSGILHCLNEVGLARERIARYEKCAFHPEACECIGETADRAITVVHVFDRQKGKRAR